MDAQSDNHPLFSIRSFRRASPEQRLMAIIAHQACKRFRKGSARAAGRLTLADVRQVLQSLAEDPPFKQEPRCNGPNYDVRSLETEDAVA